MELYAKSKAKQLSIKEVEALKETLESFLDSLEGILTQRRTDNNSANSENTESKRRKAENFERT